VFVFWCLRVGTWRWRWLRSWKLFRQFNNWPRRTTLWMLYYQGDNR